MANMAFPGCFFLNFCKYPDVAPALLIIFWIPVIQMVPSSILHAFCNIGPGIIIFKWPRTSLMHLLACLYYCQPHLGISGNRFKASTNLLVHFFPCLPLDILPMWTPSPTHSPLFISPQADQRTIYPPPGEEKWKMLGKIFSAAVPQRLIFSAHVAIFSDKFYVAGRQRNDILTNFCRKFLAFSEGLGSFWGLCVLTNHSLIF